MFDVFVLLIKSLGGMFGSIAKKKTKSHVYWLMFTESISHFPMLHH